MNDGNAQIYNFISFVFLMLTVVVIVFVVVRFITYEKPVDTRPLSALPTLVPPTETATPTEPGTATAPPTFTPTTTMTETPTLTLTPRNTVEPSATITVTPGPSETPVDTPTPINSPEPTLPLVTRTPTDSPFFFALNGDVRFQQNTSSVGCQFQALGGNVIGMDGLEYPRQLQVRVIGPSLERERVTGSSTQYGPVSGWEVPIGTQPLAGEFVVRLESLAGTQLSPDIRVTFPGTCEQNIAIVQFQQNKPIGG
jgi:hypothetical protein